MEEDRKRKAMEEEISKKEQQNLKKCQAIVAQLLDTRDMLHKIGNQAMNYSNIEVLYSPRIGATGEFKLCGKQTIDQLLYLLLCSIKPISTNNLQQRFGITDEIQSYLEPLIKHLL